MLEAMVNSFVNLNVDSEDTVMILFCCLSPIWSCCRRKASAGNLSASCRCLFPRICLSAIFFKHIHARTLAYNVRLSPAAMQQKKWDMSTTFKMFTNGFCVQHDFSLKVLGDDNSVVASVTTIRPSVGRQPTAN